MKTGEAVVHIGGKCLGTAYINWKESNNRYQFSIREIPQHKFVEYEPSDMEWMVPLGAAPVKKAVAEQLRKRVAIRAELRHLKFVPCY